MVLQFTFDGEFTDLNNYIRAERSNRFMAAKIKKMETERVAWGVIQPEKVVGRAVISFDWYTKNERKDPDNVSFAKKFILDGMVGGGVLKDDTRKCIKGFVDSFFVDKDNPRVEVTIVV
jgi:Holliday junction resolvase RusA-like endonuclease